MRTGPVPWLGFLVDFVKGEYKGQCGAVRDVNRYKVIPSLPGKRSGLVLTVERYVFTANPASKFVKVDYDAVRFHLSGAKYRLCDVFMPTTRQSFYMPDHEYQREHFLHDHTSQPSIVEFPSTDHDGDSVPSTPLCNDLEQETIFCAAWDLSGSTPAPDMPTAQTPLFESRSPVLWSPFPWTPASPSPPPFRSPSPEFPHPDHDHWILKQSLVGIPIKVDIRGGPLDTLSKKDGIFVESVAGQDGTIYTVHRPTSAKTVYVPADSIIPFRVRPKPATEKGLMVVVRNHSQHIGKLVRRIHHFYENEKTEDNHCLLLITVDRSGPREEKGREHLEMHPDDLEFVKETAQERKWSTALLRDIRAEFVYSSVDVRPRV
ncbi:hypothetical protein F5880DRAFT_1512435 [Lentinula raphanica]|nr:hypothetical protein F5880DRAFT_1512435 [Lentinula raphanica]